MLFSISKLKKTYGDKTLFQDLDFGMLPGERVALVGVNGAGKSTFLRILLGKEETDAGQVVPKNNLRISHYEQNPQFEPEETVQTHLFQGGGAMLRLIRDYEEACENLENASPSEEERFNHLSKEMDRLGAWEYEARVRSILKELGVENLDLPMKSLSGGMLRKVELAKALVADYELLILDEPTNHLDVETILWLEEYLLEREEALLLITHDRYFLDRVVGKILEFDSGKTYVYQGNYSEYLALKSAREETQAIQDNKARLFLKQELQWLRRQPKARGTKQKARIDRYDSVKSNLNLERKQELELVFSGKRQGKTILELEKISKSFGERKIVDKLTYTFKAKERLGIVGPNGIGKSTLLSLFCGKELPDSGTVKPGQNTKFGYFDQIHRELPLDRKVIDYIKDAAGEMIALDSGEKVSAGKLLERFLFDGKLQHSLIQKLSGGERRRLYLVQILMQSPNFLILDEPTNDLDIQTLSILEDFLSEFPGTVVTVSHDRYFMDRIAESLLVFGKDGEISHYVGSYSDYLLEEKPEPVQSEKPTNAIQSSPAKEKKVNPKQLEKIEKEIAEFELSKRRKEEELIQFASDPKKLLELTTELKQIEGKLAEKLLLWESMHS